MDTADTSTFHYLLRFSDALSEKLEEKYAS